MAGKLSVERQVAGENQHIRLAVDHLLHKGFHQFLAVCQGLAVAACDLLLKEGAVVGQLRCKVVQIGGHKDGHSIGGFAKRIERHEQHQRQQQENSPHECQLLSGV